MEEEEEEEEQHARCTGCKVLTWLRQQQEGHQREVCSSEVSRADFQVGDEKEIRMQELRASKPRAQSRRHQHHAGGGTLCRKMQNVISVLEMNKPNHACYMLYTLLY